MTSVHYLNHYKENNIYIYRHYTLFLKILLIITEYLFVNNTKDLRALTRYYLEMFTLNNNLLI